MSLKNTVKECSEELTKQNKPHDRASLEAEGFVCGTSEYNLEKRRRYHAANRERINKTKSEKYHADAELRARSLLRKRIQYRENKEEHNARKVQWARENRERLRIKQREWYQRNKEREAAKVRERRANNVHLSKPTYGLKKLAAAAIDRPGIDAYNRRVMRILTEINERCSSAAGPGSAGSEHRPSVKPDNADKINKRPVKNKV